MSHKFNHSSAGNSDLLMSLPQRVNQGCGLLKVGLDKDTCPGSLLWLRFLLDVGWSHQFLVMRPFLRTAPSVSLSFSQSDQRRQGEKGKAQYSCNLNVEETSHVCCVLSNRSNYVLPMNMRKGCTGINIRR